jgi:hypothetical protein
MRKGSKTVTTRQPSKTVHGKEQGIVHWTQLPEDANLLKHMTAIPNKAAGSKYGTCGVRIDGNPQFIDAILGRLKGLIEGEGEETRLEFSRSEVKPTVIKGEHKGFENSVIGAQVVYIRLHERGPEAIMANRFIASFTGKAPKSTTRKPTAKKAR